MLIGCFLFSHRLQIDIASGKVSTVVDIVRKPESANGFPGLYIDQLPRSLWVSSTKIVTSSTWRSRRTLLSIDTESGKIEEVTSASKYPGSVTALFANARFIISTYSTPTEPWSLWLGQIKDSKGDKLDVHFTILENSKVEKPKVYYQPHSWSVVANIPGQLESLETLFLEPSKENQNATVVSGTKPPLVIFPHGGPHSGFAAEFSVLNLVLVSLGFSVALGESSLFFGIYSRFKNKNLDLTLYFDLRFSSQLHWKSWIWAGFGRSLGWPSG